MRGVWSHISETMAKRSKLPAWLLSFMVSLAPIYIAPSITVSALWVAPALLVVLYALWIAFAATQDALTLANKDKLPALVSVYSQGGENVLLLEASKLYGQGMRVAIYHREETGFEVFVADGRVRNIQDNGLIQVEITRWEQREGALLDRLSRQERTAMERIMVKPAAVGDAEIAPMEELLRLLATVRDHQEEVQE